MKRRTSELSFDQSYASTLMNYHSIRALSVEISIVTSKTMCYSFTPQHHTIYNADFQNNSIARMKLVVVVEVVDTRYLLTNDSGASRSFSLVQTTGQKELSETSTDVFVHLLAVVFDLIRDQETLHS